MNKLMENDIKSASFQDSLMMLRETAEYLKRLPPVPSTYHLINKIEAFIDKPESQTTRRLSEEHSKEVELRNTVRTATLETIVGATIIEVEVQGDSLKMFLPMHQMWRTAISRLKKGVVLDLKPSK